MTRALYCSIEIPWRLIEDQELFCHGGGCWEYIMLGRRVEVLMGRSSPPPPKEAELWVVASLTTDAASLGDAVAKFGDKDIFLGSGELAGGLEKTLLSVPWIFEIANSRSMSLTSIVVSRCSTVASGSAMLAIRLSNWNGAGVETSGKGKLSSLALFAF